MRSVTLDSNVYISALQFGGKPMQLLDMAINGEIEIAVSQPIITEVGRVTFAERGTCKIPTRTPSRGASKTTKTVWRILATDYAD